MLHGISLLPDGSPGSKSASQYFEDAFRLTVMADEAGLSSVKMTEHYLHPYGGYCPSPLSFLSNVAARTSRIRLMTGCILPAFHHPVQIAAETAMLDVMSGGRLDVGVARAWLPYEFDAFGVSLDDSRELFTTTLDAVVRLWTEDSVTSKTRFFELNEVSSTPKPIQRPHPPIWGAAVFSPQSFATLGAAGHNLLLPSSISGPATSQALISVYRRAFGLTHTRAQRGEVGISIPLVIGETAAEAIRIADRHLGHYLDVWASAADAWNTTTSRDYPTYSGMSHALRASSPRSLRELGAAVVGDSASVAEQIAALGQRLDVDQILWQVDFGAMAFQPAEATLHRLVEEVLPALATA